MSDFTFRFARLLDVQHRREDLLRQKLARLEHEAERARSTVLASRRRLSDEEARLRVKSEGLLGIDQIRLHSEYIAKLRRELTWDEEALAKAVALCDDARTAVLEAMKERKKYESLEAGEREIWQRQERRAEQRTTDEMALRTAFSKEGMQT